MRVFRWIVLGAVLAFMSFFVLKHVSMLDSARDLDRFDRDLVSHMRTPSQTTSPLTIRSFIARSSGTEAGVASSGPRLGQTLFAPRFAHGAKLVTNDYAYFNPGSGRAVRSGNWIVTSGSLFATHGVAWTGIPDAATPNAHSSNGTGSATFRVVTRLRDFRNVAVSCDLMTNRYVTTRRTPAHGWDGVHIFLHYRSQHSLYALAVNRRDGVVLVKKKRPGGPANGGTYYTIGTEVKYSPSLGQWQRVLAIITSNPNRTVTISLYIDGRELLSRTDTGIGGEALTAPGAVGIRGDNAEFEFRNFRVRAAAYARPRADGALASQLRRRSYQEKARRGT